MGPAQRPGRSDSEFPRTSLSRLAAPRVASIRETEPPEPVWPTARPTARSGGDGVEGCALAEAALAEAAAGESDVGEAAGLPLVGRLGREGRRGEKKGGQDRESLHGAPHH